MTDLEEENIAERIPELSFICYKLLNELKTDAKNENDILEKHFETYYKKYPIPAISFKDINLEWFNVSEHLSIEDHLLSRIVIMDFFTYCCINCLHILPYLDTIEKKYRAENSPVLVVGIHSAKFSNEKHTKNVLDAVQKNSIKHPVANDVTCKLWNNLGISCWPTLLILGPGAVPLFILVGEGHIEKLLNVVDKAVSYFSNLRKLEVNKLPLMPSVFIPSKESDLQYPGKVTFNGDGLIISDTGNNRILLTNFEGETQRVIGSGRKGFLDGSFDEAAFNNPQGVAYHPSGRLYVADTQNHAIREIDLNRGLVKTIAGNGKKGEDMIGGQNEMEQEISSPWDLCLAHTFDVCNTSSPPNLLLIAMAGSHQIWAIFLTNGQWLKKCCYRKGAVVCVAGTGIEENRNTSYPLKAGFAQPSGICIMTTDNEQIAYIADSESSTIRQFSLMDGAVKKVAGGAINPADLFAYGDIDGEGSLSKFQHPLGVTTDNDRVYLADSYNHKLKIITKKGKKHEVESLDLNNGENADSKMLNEPGGLCYCKARNSLFIANTNNSCIEEFNLDEKILKRLNIIGDNTASSSMTEDTVDSKGDEFTLKVVPLGQNEVVFKLKLDLPDSYHSTPGTKHVYQIITNHKNVRGSFEGLDVQITVPLCLQDTSEEVLNLKCALKLCSDEGMCLVKEICQTYKIHKDGSNKDSKFIHVTLKPIVKNKTLVI